MFDELRYLDEIPTEEARLLYAVQAGDRDAFDMLYNMYWEDTYHSGFRWTNDPEVVKDSLQEVFASIWLNRKRPISNISGYLKIAIRNRIFKVLQKTKEFDSWNNVLDNFLTSDMAADRNIKSCELLLQLEKLVAGLPPQRQKIVRMRFMEDISTRAIAKMMGITQKTVQNQLSRAVASMKIEISQLTLFMVILLNLEF